MKNKPPRVWERFVESAVLDRFEPPPPELSRRRRRLWLWAALVAAAALWFATR